MTIRHRRLGRLLDVRQVRLKVAACDLARAARTAASTSLIMARIGELSAGINVPAYAVTGYEIKATAATLAALASASIHQGRRLIDAETQRANLANNLRYQRAANDVVRSAINRSLVDGTGR